MNSSEEMRSKSVRKEKMKAFPRKRKGTFEKTAARATDRNKYRKDFKRLPKNK